MNSLFELPSKTIKGTKQLLQTTKSSKVVADNIKQAEAKVVWPRTYHICNTREKLEDLAKIIKKTGLIYIDTETSSVNPWDGKLYCISIWVDGHGYLIPLEHILIPCVPVGDFNKTVGPLLNNQVKLINHTLKFDLHFIRNWCGIPVGEMYCDLFLQAKLIDPTGEHGLKELCARYGLAESTGNYTAQFGKHAWAYLPPTLAAYYAIKDVELAEKLFHKQNQILASKTKLSKLFWNIEMVVANEAFRIEERGIRIDENYFKNVLTPKVYQEYNTTAEAMSKYITPYLETGQVITDILDSPKQLGNLFFDTFGLPLIKNITLRKHFDTKEYTLRSLDKTAIEYFQRDYEYMKLLGDYRKISVVKKMFVDSIPAKIIDGRLHFTINSAGTETGRMSMAGPNFQQVPARSGPVVRQSYIPDDGNILISMDFSQQELRIMAHYTQDPTLLKIFQDEEDFYAVTAAEVFGNKTLAQYKAMSSEELKADKDRKLAKVLVLGLSYGMGDAKFARSVGISDEEGKRYYDKYHDSFPGVKKYMERTADYVRKTGRIVTMLWRERPLPNINSSITGLKMEAERAAANTPSQGSAADMTKKAIVDSTKLIRENKWPVRLWNVVHDELVWEVDKKWAYKNKDKIDMIRITLENALPLSVPMKSTVTYEERWGVKLDEDDDYEFVEE